MTNLLLGLTLGGLFLALLLLGLALLEQGLRDQDLVLGRDAPTLTMLVGPLEHTTRWRCGSERRTAAQWSAGSRAFSAKHLVWYVCTAMKAGSSSARRSQGMLHCILMLSHSDGPLLTPRRTEAVVLVVEHFSSCVRTDCAAVLHPSQGKGWVCSTYVLMVAACFAGILAVMLRVSCRGMRLATVVL